MEVKKFVANIKANAQVNTQEELDRLEKTVKFNKALSQSQVEMFEARIAKLESIISTLTSFCKLVTEGSK